VTALANPVDERGRGDALLLRTEVLVQLEQAGIDADRDPLALRRP
jgi:hypothetical protein